MIISASRRTDIPAFYMDWFMERLRAGYAVARNPVNRAQARRVDLSPEAVDGIVFWSKNPAPLLSRTDTLSAYPYYLQYTLNAYGTDIEPGPPPMDARVGAFHALADAIGPHRALWRYDPILLTETYTAAFHVEAFARIARMLRGYTERVTISFIDRYAKIEKAMASLGMRRPDGPEACGIARTLSGIAKENGMTIAACAEETDFSGLGVGRARCVDAALLSRIAEKPVNGGRDPNQRPACGCAPSVDIGMYNTCAHGCAYCYANAGGKAVLRNLAAHRPDGEEIAGG